MMMMIMMGGLLYTMASSAGPLWRSCSTGLVLLLMLGMALCAHIQPRVHDPQEEDLRITVVPTEPSLSVDVQGVPVYIGSLGNGMKRSNYMYLDETGLRNCTGHGATCEPIIDNTWKTKIIIGCTVAAAIEIFIVLLLVLYWKQIRWTLRKITCPCDSCLESPHSSHERVQRANRNSQGTSLVEVELEEHRPSHTALLYADQAASPDNQPSTSFHIDEAETEASALQNSNSDTQQNPRQQQHKSSLDRMDSSSSSSEEVRPGQSSLLCPGQSSNAEPMEVIASTSGVHPQKADIS